MLAYSEVSDIRYKDILVGAGLRSGLLGVGCLNNLALVGAQDSLGIDSSGLINRDGLSIVGEVLAIVAVLNGSTSGSASQGNRKVLLKGSAILRIKDRSIYIDNRSLTAILKSESYLGQEFRSCFASVSIRGVEALIGRLSGTIEISSTIRTNCCFNIHKQITTIVNERLVKCDGPFAQRAIFHNFYSFDCGITLDGYRCALILRRVGSQIL